jgi:hypothetical protein
MPEALYPVAFLGQNPAGRKGNFSDCLINIVCLCERRATERSKLRCCEAQNGFCFEQYVARFFLRLIQLPRAKANGKK